MPKHKGSVNHTCLYSCKLIIKFSSKVGKNKYPLAESKGAQITMVAGGRNRHYLSLNFAKIEGQFDRSNIAQANI
jgi:hypothetical protein